MATFEVTYTGTDVPKETIKAHSMTVSGDDYKFTDAKGELIALIPRSQVRKMQMLED